MKIKALLLGLFSLVCLGGLVACGDEGTDSDYQSYIQASQELGTSSDDDSSSRYGRDSSSDDENSSSTSHTYVHTHVYDQKDLLERCKKSDATCQSPAVYYYSCLCGERGPTTFTYGSALNHQYTWLKDSDYLAEKDECGWDEYYYFCSVCGEKDELWTHLDFDAGKKHVFPDEWQFDGIKHLRTCLCYEKITEESEHEYKNDVCTVCDYEFVAVESIMLAKDTYYHDKTAYMGSTPIQPIIKPDNASMKTLEWTFSEEGWTVSESAEETGTYHIEYSGSTRAVATLTITAHNGKSVSCTVVSETCLYELRFAQSVYELEIGQGSNGAIWCYRGPGVSYGECCEIEYSFSDESVATYRDGDIVALKEGITYLTISTHTGLSATCLLVCNEAEEPFTLTAPDCPMEITNFGWYEVGGVVTSYFETQTATINEITYEFIEYSADVLKIKIKVNGIKDWCKYSGSYQFKINYKLYDGNGTVVDSGTMSSYSCAVGEGFEIIETIVFTGFDFENTAPEKKAYTLTLSDVAW